MQFAGADGLHPTNAGSIQVTAVRPQRLRKIRAPVLRNISSVQIEEQWKYRARASAHAWGSLDDLAPLLTGAIGGTVTVGALRLLHRR
jgi:hypothetical protein